MKNYLFLNLIAGLLLFSASTFADPNDEFVSALARVSDSIFSCVKYTNGGLTIKYPNSTFTLDNGGHKYPNHYSIQFAFGKSKTSQIATYTRYFQFDKAHQTTVSVDHGSTIYNFREGALGLIFWSTGRITLRGAEDFICNK